VIFNLSSAKFCILGDANLKASGATVQKYKALGVDIKNVSGSSPALSRGVSNASSVDDGKSVSGMSEAAIVARSNVQQVEFCF
jgi:hypothetical protein